MGWWKSYHKLFGKLLATTGQKLRNVWRWDGADAPKASQDMLGRHISKWNYATSDVYTGLLIQKCPQIKNLIIDMPQFFGYFHIPISICCCIFFSSSLALVPVKAQQPHNPIRWHTGQSRSWSWQFFFSELLGESQLVWWKTRWQSSVAIHNGDSVVPSYYWCQKIGLSKKEGNQNWLLIIDILIL